MREEMRVTQDSRRFCSRPRRALLTEAGALRARLFIGAHQFRLGEQPAFSDLVTHRESRHESRALRGKRALTRFAMHAGHWRPCFLDALFPSSMWRVLCFAALRRSIESCQRSHTGAPLDGMLGLV